MGGPAPAGAAHGAAALIPSDDVWCRDWESAEVCEALKGRIASYRAKPPRTPTAGDIGSRAHEIVKETVPPELMAQSRAHLDREGIAEGDLFIRADGNSYYVQKDERKLDAIIAGLTAVKGKMDDARGTTSGDDKMERVISAFSTVKYHARDDRIEEERRAAEARSHREIANLFMWYAPIAGIAIIAGLAVIKHGAVLLIRKVAPGLLRWLGITGAAAIGAYAADEGRAHAAGHGQPIQAEGNFFVRAASAVWGVVDYAFGGEGEAH